MTAAALALVAFACTDDLDQKPVIGTTSEQIYSSVEGYQSVLAKIYGSYSLIGAERGGGSSDISSNQGQDMLRTLFNLQELPTDDAAYKYMSGDNLTDISYISWDENDVWFLTPTTVCTISSHCLMNFYVIAMKAPYQDSMLLNSRKSDSMPLRHVS